MDSHGQRRTATDGVRAIPDRLTLLHRDRDFESIAAVTGQALQWYGPEAGE